MNPVVEALAQAGFHATVQATPELKVVATADLRTFSSRGGGTVVALREEWDDRDGVFVYWRQFDGKYSMTTWVSKQLGDAVILAVLRAIGAIT